MSEALPLLRSAAASGAVLCRRGSPSWLGAAAGFAAAQAGEAVVGL